MDELLLPVNAEGQALTTTQLKSHFSVLETKWNSSNAKLAEHAAEQHQGRWSFRSISIAGVWRRSARASCKMLQGGIKVIGCLTDGYDSASDAGTEDNYSYYVADGLRLKPPHIDNNKISNNNYKFSLKMHCRHHRSSATHLDAAQSNFAIIITVFNFHEMSMNSYLAAD
jgi:hypothetical protein